jgi:hypothetical protein
MIASKRFKPISLLWIGAVCLPLCVSGCRYGSHSDENDAHVRLINAVPETRGLNVFVDGKKAWKGSQFRSSTGYEGISAGTYPVRLAAVDSDATLLTRSLSFEKGHVYTVLALAQKGKRPAEVQIFEEEPITQGKSEKARVRFVNAAEGLPPVDLVVNNIVGLQSVGYGKHSPALSLDGGRYDWKLVAADTPDTLLGPVSLRLEPGHAYTLVAMGNAAGQTLTLEIYPDAR